MTMATLSAAEKDAKLLEFVEEATRKTRETQLLVLVEILTQNGQAEYLQSCCGLSGATDRETFKRKVPMVTYDDLKPFITRIANGDRSPILSGHPISEFLTSSGTSGGERKLMPSIEKDLESRQFLSDVLIAVMNKFVPDLNKGKALFFLFVKPDTKTSGGLPARSVLTSYCKSDIFKYRKSYLHLVYTSPIDCILCANSVESMYSQMLCGLLQNQEVLRIGAVFASGLLRAIRFLQVHWEELANDIELGTLSSRVTDPSVRSAVAKLLNPSPDLARFVRTNCSNQNWEGIIPKIWPNTKYIEVIVTGAMAQYIPTLNFYGGGLPLVSAIYASSESYFGLNLNPLCKPSEVTYTLMPNMAYFEFLPHDSNQADPSHTQLVDLADVQVGKEYELVITTRAGLYRYRVGDILRVKGFYNSAPRFEFIRRKNVALSIDSDKTDEAELQKAVNAASNRLMEGYNTRIMEYTSYADTKNIPGHYVIFFELASVANVPDIVLEECCLLMEEELNSVYRQGRVCDQSIGPLEIRVVQNGTFDELMEYAISKGTSIDQFKAPRCVSAAPILELLDARIISSHFSPALPHWSPNRRH